MPRTFRSDHRLAAFAVYLYRKLIGFDPCYRVLGRGDVLHTVQW